MKETKERHCEQQTQEEKDAICVQMVQNLEKTRAILRNPVSRASTFSAEEHQLTLTEDDFLAIQRKMNKMIRDGMSYTKIGMQNTGMLY